MESNVTVFGQDVFEVLGYHIDVFEANKYLGSIKIAEPDREVMGYSGRQLKYICGNVRKGHNVKFVEGEYFTECVPVCGKIKTDRFKILENAHEWRNIVRS